LKYNVTTATIVIAFENIVLSGREQEVSEYERRKPNRKSDYNIRSTFSSENNRKIGNVNRSVSVVYKKKLSSVKGSD